VFIDLPQLFIVGTYLFVVKENDNYVSIFTAGFFLAGALEYFRSTSRN